jgi:teichuronic acid biosynthesis glycosyltransferase TuaC
MGLGLLSGTRVRTNLNGHIRMSLVTIKQSEGNADILVVTNMWPHRLKNHYGIFVKRQVDSLEQAGLDCDVMVIHGYKSRLAYLLAAATLLGWKLGRRRHYRLVHAHGGEALPVARCFLHTPLVASFSGDDLLGTPLPSGSVSFTSRLKTRILRQLARLAAATITKSREMEDQLPRRIRSRNTVLPNGVDESLFRKMDRDAARRALGWSATERVALFAGDPEVARKRHWLAKAACEEASKHVGQIRLHVAHETPPEVMPLLMNAADCLLLTSSSEGSPNVVKEALMCDLPVVATAAGDVGELLHEVEPSYVCPASASALGGRLATCLAGHQRSNGRSKSAHLEQAAIAERLLLLYARLGAIDPGLTNSAGSRPRSVLVSSGQ